MGKQAVYIQLYLAMFACSIRAAYGDCYSIELRNYTDDYDSYTPVKSFKVSKPFRKLTANFPQKEADSETITVPVIGRLVNPVAFGRCGPYSPPPVTPSTLALGGTAGAGLEANPDWDNITSVWIAILDGYPDCIEEKISAIRNASYDLLIVYNDNDTTIAVTREAEDQDFPIAVTTAEIAEYLIANGTVDLRDPQRDTLFLFLGFCENVIEAVTILGAIIGLAIIIAIAVCVVILCFFLKHRWDEARYRRELRERREEFRSTVNVNDTRTRAERTERDFQLHRARGGANVRIRTLTDQEKAALKVKKFDIADKNLIETCAICLEDFESKEDIKILPCKHNFHPLCIDKWLGSCTAECPFCRKGVRTASFTRLINRVSLAPARRARYSVLEEEQGQNYGSVASAGTV